MKNPLSADFFLNIVVLLVSSQSITYDLFRIITNESFAIETIMNILGVSKSTAKRRLNLIKLILPYIAQKPQSIDEFKYLLVTILRDKLRIKDAISWLTKKLLPVTPYFLAKVLSRFKLSVDENLARDLINLSKELEILEFRRIGIFVETDEDLVREILIKKGYVLFKEIKRKFPNARDLVLSLWKKGEVKIHGIEKTGITPSTLTDPDNIPLDIIKEQSNFIEFEEDIETGEIRAKLVIPDNVVIEFVF